MTKFAEWLLVLVKDLFDAVWNFLGDVVIYLMGLLLQAVVSTMNLIVLPCFMSVSAGGSALSSAFSLIHPAILYFASMLHLDRCFAMLSCAIIFVFARKALTLFQW